MSLMINVGCGSRIHPDWMNLDLHAHAPGVIACDLTKGIPVGDGEADVVYAAAVLEHIRPVDVPGFLAECRRVLKSGGVLRLAVPDLEQQARVYLDALERLDRGEPGAAADREWMVLEMFDQSMREKVGGAMLEFLTRKQIPNKDFIIGRIGVEGRDLIEHLASQADLPPRPRKPTLFEMVPGGRFGRALLKKLLRSGDLEGDLRSLEIGRFRQKSGEVHQWSYDRFSLGMVMQAAGFLSTKKCRHGESRVERWSEFHLEVDASSTVEKPDLLVMEAVK